MENETAHWWGRKIWKNIEKKLGENAMAKYVKFLPMIHCN